MIFINVIYIVYIKSSYEHCLYSFQSISISKNISVQDTISVNFYAKFSLQFHNFFITITWHWKFIFFVLHFFPSLSSVFIIRWQHPTTTNVDSRIETINVNICRSEGKQIHYWEMWRKNAGLWKMFSVSSMLQLKDDINSYLLRVILDVCSFRIDWQLCWLDFRIV
jgi:hypothetical protein